MKIRLKVAIFESRRTVRGFNLRVEEEKNGFPPDKLWHQKHGNGAPLPHTRGGGGGSASTEDFIPYRARGGRLPEAGAAALGIPPRAEEVS